MASWGESSTDARGADEHGTEEIVRVVRLAASVVIAVVAGVATFLAGVGGATEFPPVYVAPVALFVTVGLFVAFYIDLSAGLDHG